LSEKSKKQLKLDRAVARHGNIHAAGRSRAILGILGKALVVVIVSTLTVATVSAIQITQELSRGQIDVPSLDGGDRVIPPLDGPLNILLVGSDTRSGAGNSAFGDTGGNLADVIILLHVSEDRQNAVALSFPRDTMLPWPACPSTSGGPGYLPQSLGQINATIANGGPGCTLLTVELLTGLNIPYLAMVDFNGVIELSNAVGVEVCVAQDIEDEYTNTYLKKGMHTLQGVQALQFLRTRHGVGDGSDLGRISNQQVYLTSLVRKLKSRDILSNPVALYSLAQAAAKNMTLSKTLAEPTTLMGVANALKDIPMKKITFLQLPSVYGLPAPLQGRVKPDYEKAQVIFDMMKNDEPIVLAEVNNPGVGSELAPTLKPTPKPTSTTTPTKKPTPTPTPTITPLPDWAQGTNAQTTTCSK